MTTKNSGANEPVEVIVVEGGLTLSFLRDGTYAPGDPTAFGLVLEPGYTCSLPAELALMDEAEQLRELGRFAFRPLREDETGVPIVESPMFPGAEERVKAREDGSLLKLDEVCEVLRISRRTGAEMIRRGLLHGERLDPTSERSEWRVHRASLRRFLPGAEAGLGDEELRLLGRPPRPTGTVAVHAGATQIGTVTSVDPDAFSDLDDEAE